MTTISNVNFACDDPAELADFYAAALDGERRETDSPLVVVDLPDGAPSLMFREAPKGTDRDLPIHLDLGADDREATVERLQDLGASVRETKSVGDGAEAFTWTVMEDPEGNGFCVSDGE